MTCRIAKNFTFQSGSIQMKGLDFFEILREDFTFQSGSIQIGQQDADFPRVIALYIPIWFYSNVV